ncbi:hypothetical protein, partial [Streptomyces sp. NPDC006307]|uniref:hypothetical protein n=1 Tax=Streptomyces sp. NPDC006307 TaxID=3156748 RepID=UPI0033A8B666
MTSASTSAPLGDDGTLDGTGPGALSIALVSEHASPLERTALQLLLDCLNHRPGEIALRVKMLVSRSRTERPRDL